MFVDSVYTLTLFFPYHFFQSSFFGNFIISFLHFGSATRKVSIAKKQEEKN